MKAWKLSIWIWILITILAVGGRYIEQLDTVLFAPCQYVEDEVLFANDSIDSAIDSVVEADSAVSIQPRYPIYEGLNHRPNLTQLMSGADTAQVRVVHYGDSQIEEDRITVTLRRHLQALYGGGGVGLVPLHQTIPTRTLRQHVWINDRLQTTSQGPKRYLIYGPKIMRRDTNLYGPMGQVAVLNDSLVPGSEHLVWQAEPMAVKPFSEKYFNQIHIWGTHDSIIRVADSTTTYTLTFDGAQDVYGISLETNCGVMVDNIPMRGCSGYIFTSIQQEQLVRYFSVTNTRLIILQFGGNMISHMQSEAGASAYASEMRRHVEYLKRCAPEAALLFIGPSDMLTLQDGEWVSHPMVPVVDSYLHRMADAAGISYWSLYQAMGGEGSMLHWQEIGWTGDDGIHFTRSGADKAAEMLWEWLTQKDEE